MKKVGEEKLRKLAKMIEDEIGDDFGFALYTFELEDEDSRGSYISNVDRSDAVYATRIIIDQLENPQHDTATSSN